MEAVDRPASWFLWTLFVIEVLSSYRAGTPCLAAFRQLVDLCHLGKICPVGLWHTVVRNAPFFLMGCIASHQLRNLQPAFTMGQSVVFIVVGILLFAMLALMMSMSVDQSELLYLLDGVVGSTATVACTLAIRGAWLKADSAVTRLGFAGDLSSSPLFSGRKIRELLVRFAKLDPRCAFPFIILAHWSALCSLGKLFEARPLLALSVAAAPKVVWLEPLQARSP